jgi:hypothetical protein
VRGTYVYRTDGKLCLLSLELAAEVELGGAYLGTLAGEDPSSRLSYSLLQAERH